ncbi:kinase-like domain-containing protein [Suillus occidentalis]|nr:kinase-like domain-containing protein [Suillus occidentalis]
MWPDSSVCGMKTKSEGTVSPSIVSEFYEGRTLKNNQAHIQSDRQRLKLLRQFSGLAYLHRNYVIHGDLKPTDVLLDDSFNAILTVFALSCVLEGSGFTTTYIIPVGTSRYMARELLNPVCPSTTAPLPTVHPTTRLFTVEFMVRHDKCSLHRL